MCKQNFQFNSGPPEGKWFQLQIILSYQTDKYRDLDTGLSDGNGKKFKLYLHFSYRNLRPKFIKSDIKTKYFTGFSTFYKIRIVVEMKIKKYH